MSIDPDPAAVERIPSAKALIALRLVALAVIYSVPVALVEMATSAFIDMTRAGWLVSAALSVGLLCTWTYLIDRSGGRHLTTDDADRRA